MLKVASYNIHKAVGTDRRRNPERILEVLDEIDADVIALQEADLRFGERVAALPHWLLEAHSTYHAVPLAIRTFSMGWHGNAILVRNGHEVLDHDLIHLPSLEPRGAVATTLRIGSTTLRIVGMHLDLSGLWRRRQASALLHHLDQHSPDSVDATIMMGDLNEWSQARGCLKDFAHHFEILTCGRSFHANRPIAALDRIMWRGALELEESGVHQSAVARRASDHLPIWAQFRPLTDR